MPKRKKQKHPIELVRRIAELKLLGEKWQTITDTVNSQFPSKKPLTIHAVRCLFNREKSKGTLSNIDPFAADKFNQRAVEVLHQNRRPKENMSYEDCLDAFQKAKKFRDEFSINYRHAHCYIKTERPVAVTIISDVHIGSPHTDYDAFQSDIDKLASDPRFYLLKGGDWCDKFMPQFSDKAAVTGQLHPAQIQLLTAEKIMDALNGKIVGAIGGNHDQMDRRQTGLDSEYWIHRDKPFPYLPDGGVLSLTVGAETYEIVWFHKYSVGNSRVNPHNQFRWLRQEIKGDADIYILEHTHNPSMMLRQAAEFGMREMVEVRAGTYKINDPFSLQGFKDGRVAPHTMILFPDRHKIFPVPGEDALSDAKHYLDGWEVQTVGNKEKAPTKSNAHQSVTTRRVGQAVVGR